MEKEKVVFFLDYANINRAAREKKYRSDYGDLLQYVGEGRFLLDAHCYVPINPRNEHRLDGVIEELWAAGYIVTTKVGTIAGGTYKCNFDVEITMDILKAVYQMKPDIIVLATGDADFLSLMLEVRKSGVRVEVAAFEESTGADMMSKCSGFIDLAVYYADYLAAQQDKRGEERLEERIAEQYKELIQSQSGEQDEDGTGEQDQDLLQPQDDGLDESEMQPVADQVDEPMSVPASDTVNELEL